MHSEDTDIVLVMLVLEGVCVAMHWSFVMPRCHCWVENRPPIKKFQQTVCCGQKLTIEKRQEGDQHRLCIIR